MKVTQIPSSHKVFLSHPTATPNPWIICHKPNSSARLRLFCFPYGGGSASLFRTWPDNLPQDVEVCAIQLPGRGARLQEPPFTRLLQLVQTLAQVLRPYLTVPFAFFGHSLGAFISFELLRQLRKQNVHSPLHLFVSAQRAPQLPDPDPPIHDLPESDLVEEIRCRYDGIPQEVLENADLMSLLLPALRADFTILETYRYIDEKPLDCPITSFGGLQDCSMKQENLAAWRDQTYNSFALRMFPGDHFFIESARTQLLEALSNDLNQSLRANMQDERPKWA
ncbi:MAG: thioesterase II family protein [Candidatus Binatia bacterium]